MKEYQIILMDADGIAKVNAACREGWRVHTYTGVQFAAFGLVSKECFMERDIPEEKPAEEPRFRVGARVMVDTPIGKNRGVIVDDYRDGSGFFVYVHDLQRAQKYALDDLTPLEDEP